MRFKRALKPDSEEELTVKIFLVSIYFFDFSGTHWNCSNFRPGFDSILTEQGT